MQSTLPIYEISAGCEMSKGSLSIYNDYLEYIDSENLKSRKILFSEITAIDIKFSNSIEIKYTADTNKKLDYFDVSDAETAKKLCKILSKVKEQGTIDTDDFALLVESTTPKELNTEAQAVNATPPPVETLNTNGKSKGIATILLGLVLGLGLIICSNLILYPLKFVGYFVMFFGFFKGLQTMSNANQKVYRAVCPYCKQEFAFPVNQLNVLCPQCRKRVILKDNEFQIVD